MVRHCRAKDMDVGLIPFRCHVTTILCHVGYVYSFSPVFVCQRVELDVVRLEIWMDIKT